MSNVRHGASSCADRTSFAALGRSLVREPGGVFSLDEPLSALDALLRMELQTALAEIVRHAGCATMLVTHDVDESLYLADRIVVLAGSAARVTLACVVPAQLRRTRETFLATERRRLPAALGVDAHGVDGGRPLAATRSARGYFLGRLGSCGRFRRGRRDGSRDREASRIDPDLLARFAELGHHAFPSRRRSQAVADSRALASVETRDLAAKFPSARRYA